MPYIALTPPAPAARLELATARWDAVLARRPDLEPAVRLQRRLVGIVVDLAQAVNARPLPRLSLPAGYLVAKLRRGVPAWTGEPIPVPTALLKPAMLSLCDELARGGAGEAAEHIRASIVETRLDATSLLTASLGRDQHAIRIGATHRGLAPDLVWLVAELAVSPFAHALQREWLAPPDRSPLAAALDGWSRGYCPACGSWPALAESHGGRRVLRCSFCAFAWMLPDAACIYCGSDQAELVAAGADEATTSTSIELCGSCSGYLKRVHVQALSPFPLLAIADLETMDLDVAAMARGFARPALREHGVGR